MLQPEAKDDINAARQGVTGHHVRAVLAIGVIGVVIVFLIAYIFFFAGAPNPAGVT